MPRRITCTLLSTAPAPANRPKIVTPAKALLFPTAVEALGNRGSWILTSSAMLSSILIISRWSVRSPGKVAPTIQSRTPVQRHSSAGWSRHHPFKSGLTGETALQFCDAYRAATGKQWTQPIGFKHANLEVALDVLKRTRKLDPDSIRDAIVDTDYQSLVGPVAWKGGAHNPVKNACSTPLVGGQWKKGEKFKYDLHIVYNQPAPNISLGSPFEPIQYS